MLFKYHVIKVERRWGVSQKLTFAHRGEGGAWRGAKSAHTILEQPLKYISGISLEYLGDISGLSSTYIKKV